MLELWVKEDTEEVAWSRWGKSIWFRWSQSHHWVLCPISCVVIVALNFMISSNDLRGVDWCYSGGTVIHEKMANIYSTQEVRVKSNSLGDGNVSHPSRRHEILWVIIASHTSGQDAKALWSFINRESRREETTRVREWFNKLCKWTCITHLWGYRRICNPITYIGSQHL